MALQALALNCSLNPFAGELCDTGWTIPATAASYRAREAIIDVVFKDLTQISRKVMQAAAISAAAATHLARLSQDKPCRSAFK